jgi:hypothetical protein
VPLQQESGKKPNFDKTLFKKDLQNEKEGLFKTNIKGVIGKILWWFKTATY